VVAKPEPVSNGIAVAFGSIGKKQNSATTIISSQQVIICGTVGGFAKGVTHFNLQSVHQVNEGIMTE
jgi:hypothetical protein